MNNKSEIKCLLCGCSTELKHKAFPGYQEPLTFEIYHCINCNTAFSMPRITDTKKVYDNIYRNANKVLGYHRYWKYKKNVNKMEIPLDYLAESEETYWGVREALSKIVKNKESIKILEVGSGLGYLTFALRKAGYDAWGMDISETAVDQANQNYGSYYFCSDLYEYAEKNMDHFDVIVLTEVIEHINAPLPFMESLLKLIKTKGHVLLTTPNKSFYPLNIIWKSDLPPIHCWWFSEDSILYMGKKLNMNVSFIDLSNYYKNHITWTRLYDNQLPKPTFDKNNKLLKTSDKNLISSLISIIRSPLSRIKFIKKIYVNIIKITNHNISICKVKGTIICAILEKN